MIRFDAVTKDFIAPGGQSLRVLENVSFELSSGASCAVVGPSGSGKSTMMALLAGLEKPSTGKILVGNEPVSELSEAALSRFRAHNVGIVFQSFHLFDHFTALHNVMIAAEIAGVENPKQRALEALESVGLASRVDHLPTRLSGGEQQRVALARAIVTKPKLLLCDEPTGNLDPDNADRVFDLLLDLHKKLNTTLVLVTHDHDLAKRLEWVVELERGHLRSGPRKQGVLQ